MIQTRNERQPDYEVPADKLITHIKDLMATGNTRAVRIEADDGRIHLEVPPTGVVITDGAAVLSAPWIAILIGLSALVTRVKIEAVPRCDALSQTAHSASS